MNTDTQTASKCQSCSDRTGRFHLKHAGGWHLKCGMCSLMDGPLIRRSAKVGIVVGTVLVALNQGGALAGGSFPWATSWWKIPLTYLVPFGVSTYGALSNARA